MLFKIAVADAEMPSLRIQRCTGLDLPAASFFVCLIFQIIKLMSRASRAQSENAKQSDLTRDSRIKKPTNECSIQGY